MSSPSEPFLVFEPADELRFKGPFHTDVSTTTLKITNTSQKRITFKVKTTAPKNYCVRPNQGVVEPASSFSVSVMLQPLVIDAKEKPKHKFMVQTMVLSEGDDTDIETLWKNAAPENVITSTKMRCVFEIADGSGEAVTDKVPENGVKSLSSAKPSVQSASQSSVSQSDELKRLELNNENIQLKEELLRLRRSARANEMAPTSAGSVQAPAEPMVYIVLGLVVLVIGYIIGKIF